jgi:peptidoglycan/LPS O-acetylase OafA/YrhL
MATLAADDDAAQRTQAVEGVRAEAGELPAFDGLRGIAVAWIVLFHFMVLRGAADPWAAMLGSLPVAGPLLGQGAFAVDLFFLLSGFLLTLPWLLRARDRRPAPNTKAFYLRRVRRIVPAYAVNVACLFLVVMPLLHGVAYWRADLYVYLLNAVAHALFVHNLSPLTSGSMGANGALWTLAVEAQVYVLLPLLAPFVARAPWRSLAAGLALALGWQAAARHGMDSLVRGVMDAGAQWSEEDVRRWLLMQWPAYAGHFALGGALARLWIARRVPVGAATPLAVAGVAIVAIAASLSSDEASRIAALAGLATLVTAAACAGPAALVSRMLASGPLAFLGRISYSAYLWHLPLLLVLLARTRLAGAAVLPAYLAAVLAVGWLSWRALERPFTRRSATARAIPPPSP